MRNVDLLRASFPEETPPGSWDLIVCSEILYYLQPPALDEAVGWIKTQLAYGASVLAVSWRGIGREEPLLGDEVHDRLAVQLAALARARRTPRRLQARPLRRPMSPRRIVIVGAGPAGLATARAYREARRHRQRSRCSARRPSSHTAGRRSPRSSCAASSTPASCQSSRPDWFEEHDIQLRLGCEARTIDPSSGTVNADGYALRADVIVLATGAEPSRPDLPGLDDPRVQTMRERPDSERIATQAKPGTRTVVLGTGFIGCELAASLALRGARVTLVGQEPAPQQQRLGADAAARLARWLTDLGVTLKMGVKVSAVHNGRIVQLD